MCLFKRIIIISVLVILAIQTSESSYFLGFGKNLSLQILKVSDTLGSMLVNRGKESGLRLDDHAQFFDSKEKIARGNIIKISDRRSIWLLYKWINKDKISKGTVMRLKTVSPVVYTSIKNKKTKK